MLHSPIGDSLVYETEKDFNEEISVSKGTSLENEGCAVEGSGNGDMPLNGFISERSYSNRLGSDFLLQIMETNTVGNRILSEEFVEQKSQLANPQSIVCENNSHDYELTQNENLPSQNEDGELGIDTISKIDSDLSDDRLPVDDTEYKDEGLFSEPDYSVDNSAAECLYTSESRPNGSLSSLSLSSPSIMIETDVCSIERSTEEQVLNVVGQKLNGCVETTRELDHEDEVSGCESGDSGKGVALQHDNSLFGTYNAEDNGTEDTGSVHDCNRKLSSVVMVEEDDHKNRKDDDVITCDVMEVVDHDITEDDGSCNDSLSTLPMEPECDGKVSATDGGNSIKPNEPDDRNSQGTATSLTSDLYKDPTFDLATEISETTESFKSVVLRNDISESELRRHLTGDQVMDSVLIDDEGDSVMLRRKEPRPNSIRISAMSLSQGLSGSNTPVGRMSNFGNVGDEVDLDETQFVEINLQSCNSDGKSAAANRSTLSAETGSVSSLSSKTSRLGNFLAKNFSLKKSKDRDEDDSSTENLGWKLFGRVPPRQASQTSVPELANEHRTSLPSKLTFFDRDLIRRTDKEVPSTTALILQPRPSCLPSKNPEEDLKHKLMYKAMVEAARRSEQREVKLRKKHREQQIRHEEELSAAVRIWNSEILPNWETTRLSRKTQDLWWKGIPPSIRGKVWRLAIGNDLNVTSELYEICLVRAREKLKILRDCAAGSDTDSLSSFSAESSSNRESSVDLIKLDVSRTFPQLCIFQAGGPYHKLLQGLLGAYVCYRPDVGYVQGMSFLAAVLLLNMDEVSSFVCFANLLNKPCELAFFRLDENLMKAYFQTYQIFFKENLPKLFAHFDNQRVTPDLYIIDWMYTLFAKSLPLDVASRVWDVFCRDGEEFLFRTALGILKLYEDILLNLDFIHLAQFLTRLPETISAPELFQCIGQIRMHVNKCSFAQVFAKTQPL